MGIRRPRGTKSLYFFGDDKEQLADYGNVADGTGKEKFPEWSSAAINAKDGYAFTAPVGSFKANNFGLHDMHGNALQWCEDYYGKYEDVARKKDPVQSEKRSGDLRVLRGGSWSYVAMFCRTASRRGFPPTTAAKHVGFRVCVRQD